MDNLLPSTPVYAVEYPGFVSAASIPYIIRTLGGQTSLENAFKRSATREDSLIELRFKPDNPFSHPIAGNVVPTHNILLKVVKRKRKRRDTSGSNETVGEYKAQAIGLVTKTARFRSKFLTLSLSE